MTVRNPSEEYNGPPAPVATRTAGRRAQEPSAVHMTARPRPWETKAGYFDRRVFFVRPLGFVQPTDVRRISYEESLAFEHLHETEYQRLGFEIVDIPVGPVAERAAAIDAHIRSWA